MKLSHTLSLLVIGVGLFGCASSPTDRVSKKQAAVSSWSQDIQAKVKAGKVDIGFTQDQVWVALGEADRKYTRTTQKGTQEIWAYLSHAPSFSFGIGVGGGGGGMGGGGGGMGGGVAVSTRNEHDDELRRVIFENGVVSAIEENQTK